MRLRFVRTLAVATVLAAGLGIGLTGCGGAAQQPAGGGAAQTTHTESATTVDTPALRRLKKHAGIGDCPKVSPLKTSTMPDVTLPCLGGGPSVDLRGLKGPLVVNLFAQWCGPCREELPFYAELAKHAQGTVKVLGIDYLDPQPARALQLAQQSGVTYPLLADPQGLLRVPFRLSGLPGVVFVDAHGKVTFHELTSIRSYGQLATLVHQHLGVDVNVPAAG